MLPFAPAPLAACRIDCFNASKIAIIKLPKQIEPKLVVRARLAADAVGLETGTVTCPPVEIPIK